MNNIHVTHTYYLARLFERIREVCLAILVDVIETIIPIVRFPLPIFIGLRNVMWVSFLRCLRAKMFVGRELAVNLVFGIQSNGH